MTEGGWRLQNCHSLSYPSPKLNVGCGRVRPDGFINIDATPGDGIDYIIDLDHDRLPFEADSVYAVLASHVLEHLAHMDYVMGEFHRILRPGGIVEGYLPYGHNWNYYHVRFMKPRSFPIAFGEPASRCLAVYPSWRVKLVEISKRHLPFQWHMERYLGIPPKYGRAMELHFILEKQGGAPR
jgi:SAM-dependent methyltransferase